MGGKATTKNNASDFPDFFYINRATQELYSYKNKTIKKSPLTLQSHLSLTSAILIQDNLIYSAGGSTTSSQYSTSFICFDLITQKVFQVQPLPISSKLGFLLPYKESIVYAGGISINSLSKTKTQTHLMRFSPIQNHWEVYNHSSVKLSQDQNVGFNDLIKPGFFISQKKIFMIGGYSRKGNIRYPNRKICTFSLKSKTLKSSLESFAFLLEVYSPKCATCGSKVIIAGGKNLDSSFNSFVHIFEDKKLTLLTTLNARMNENYPIYYSKNWIILFAYPEIMAKSSDNSEWIKFQFGQESANETESSKRKKITLSPGYTPMMSLGSEEPEIILTQQNTARSSQCLQNSDSLQIMQSLNDDLMDIVDKALIVNDEDCYIESKRFIRVLGMIKEKLDKRKLGPLDVNEIQSNIEFKKEINLEDFTILVGRTLNEKDYMLKDIMIVYKYLHIIFELKKVKSCFFLIILERCEVDKQSELVGCEKTIKILINIVKLLIALPH